MDMLGIPTWPIYNILIHINEILTHTNSAQEKYRVLVKSKIVMGKRF